jgi:DNA-binding transcriptional MerR regulator
MNATLTVGALARRTNVSPKTVRYYEAIGLLPPAIRGENGYRYYPRQAVIRRAKLLGLTLAEIGGLMSLSDEDVCDVISPELHHVLERKVAERDRHLAELAAFRATPAAAAERLAPCAEESIIDICTTCSVFAPECSCLSTPSEVITQSPA